jgi:hypothetical protein
MTTCHIHSATDANCPENAKFEKELQKWSEICSHLSIWDYSMYEDNLLPFPNLKVLEDNIRAFRDAGAEGIYLQMDPDPKSINEFGDLRRYVTTSLIWDPNRSGDELTDEFCNLYYGAGGQAIRKWIQLIHDSYSKNANVHIISGRGYQPLWVDPSVAREGVQLVETAINLADNDTQRQRAEKAAIWAYRAVIEPIYHLKDTDRIDSKAADELRPYIDKYFMLCEKYGLGDRVSAKKEQLDKILKAPL